MKSNKLSLLLLLGTMLFTCQKGILNDNIDLKGDWEWKPEKFDCPCYMIYLKRDTICSLWGHYLDVNIKLFSQNDSLFFETPYGSKIINIQEKDRSFRRGDKLQFFKNWIYDPWNTPPCYASTEATIVNENLINYKVYYYDEVVKTSDYGLIRYTGVQEVNLRRIKKK